MIADEESGADGSSPGPHAEESLPYPSLPIPDTQPSRLAALAAVFGLQWPPLETARVLELGCAAGGNLVPLAARYPGARFLGVDRSGASIAQGLERIDALGLANVALIEADLAELDLGQDEFDYVICHGVFSWVPEPVRHAVLRICARNLSRVGIAAISYNVLPGWHLRSAVRDLCLHYAGVGGSPLQRVARAREALEQLACRTRADEPYGLLLQAEARRLRQRPAGYIEGEMLTPINQPFSVADFTRETSRFGLAYLCETDLDAALAPRLDPAAVGAHLALSGADREAAEQHLDFLTGRPFRRSVLIRAGRAPQSPRAGSLACLHLASPPRAGPPPPDQDMRRVLDCLAQAYPGTVGWDALCGAGVAQTAWLAIADRLFRDVLCGLATPFADPVRVGRAPQGWPRAWAVARLEARLGQPWLTSLLHTAVPASTALRALLPLMDGTRDLGALALAVAAEPVDVVATIGDAARWALMEAN